MTVTATRPFDKRRVVAVAHGCLHMRLSRVHMANGRTIAWARPSDVGWAVRVLEGPARGEYLVEDRDMAEAQLWRLTEKVSQR